ncbi:MAG: hypothetical protein LBJ11_02895 [Oscillospiraceae bacterium]|nr:hypothetical protein [Oscillospiraceae bacterium]
MEQTIYGRQVRKSRTILLLRVAAGVLLFALGVTLTVVHSRQVESRRADLAARDADSLPAGTLAKITSGGFEYSGIYDFKNGKRDKPTAYYYFVLQGDRFVVVRSPRNYTDEIGDSGRPDRTFSGRLAADPDRELFVEALADLYDLPEEEADAALRVHILGAEGKQDDALWFLICIPGILLAAFNGNSLRGRRKLEERMAAFGDPAFAAQQFEREARDGQREDFDKLTLTEHWLFSRAADNTFLFPLREIVWMHKTVTQHRTNGIPTGKTYSLSVYFSDGGSHTFPASKGGVDRVQEAFARRCPGALVGFSPELEADWKKDPQQVIRSIRKS